MPEYQIREIDKEFILMNEVEANQAITQRELSQRTGFSLGTVNLLLQKMIQQGRIKIETIPANRVVYMLTPAGMAEKAVKTVRYIKNHYLILQNTKERIKQRLEQLHQQYRLICICLPENELEALVETAAEEYSASHPDRGIRLLTCQQAAVFAPETDLADIVIVYLPDEATDFLTINKTLSGVAQANLLDALQ